jgi:hypothetical protein
MVYGGRCGMVIVIYLSQALLTVEVDGSLTIIREFGELKEDD